MINRFYGWLLLLIFALPDTYGQINGPSDERRIVYKQASDTVLYLHPYYPQAEPANGTSMIFFFGGGWRGGTINQFKPHAAYLAELGVTCFLADYRVSSRHQTDPFDAVADAKSAIRFVRGHAHEWGLDPQKIVAAGGSAGGHLAAAASMAPGLNDARDHLGVSPRANALVLFNPVYDNGPGGYGYDRIGDRYPEISPMHNIDSMTPPTLVFFGTEDPLVSVETSKRYQSKMRNYDRRCDLFLYDGQKHGFFNFNKTKYYRETVYQTHLFLYNLAFVAHLPAHPPNDSALTKAHAHNDYRHPQPLQDALRQGFTSVEVDVLPTEHELFVGHDKEELELSQRYTIDELYLAPLYQRFEKNNSIYPKSERSFLLWVDIKYEAATAYKLLKEMLAQYQEMILPSNGNPPAVQVILSGDRPFALVEEDNDRWMYLDGRPENLAQGPAASVMPFISENLEKMVGQMVGDSLQSDQIEVLNQFVQTAHSKDYQVRFWNSSDSPAVWRQLLALDVDLINTDQLKRLRSFLVSQE